MTFQQVLAPYNPDVPTLPALIAGENVAERLGDTWEAIQTDIDYILIGARVAPLGIFLADGPGHLQAVRDAVAGTDPAALMRAAHTLSGSLRVLGASAAIALVGRLEVLGRESRLEGAAALLAQFEAELERVRGAAVDAIAAGTPA